MLFIKYLLLIKEKYKDFSFLEIYYNKCIFNSNIIARDLGLSDKTENKTKLEIEPPKIEFK